MDGRLSRRGIAVLALLFVVPTPLFADRKSRIVILTGDDKSITWREVVPTRVAVDPDQSLYHRKGCPTIRPDMQWIAPAAATLRKLAAHNCPVPDAPEWATHTEARHPRDPHVISVLFLGNSLTYYNEIPRMTSAIAAREKRPLLVDAVTRSGVTLEQLWADTDALKHIWQNHWDYVVVQGGAGMASPLACSAGLFNDHT